MASKRVGICLLLAAGWALAPWSALAAAADTVPKVPAALGFPDLIGPRPAPLPADAEAWKADPFAGAGVRQPMTGDWERPKSSLPALKLQGILFGVKGRYALLNGQVVMAGDKGDGVRILKIERDRIVVEDASGRRVLPIFSE